MKPPMRYILLAMSMLAGSSIFAGCEIFTPRTPEPPLDESSQFIQPDTPEQVIENIQSAIEGLNTQNYRRSLDDDFVFQPTATAEASDPIWAGWGPTEEEQYFSTIVAAIPQPGDQRLELNDQTFTIVDDRISILDATYVLVFPHNRTGVPQTVQGRLSWEISQGDDGLWSVTRWVDSEIGSEPSWSDLKASFVS